MFKNYFETLYKKAEQEKEKSVKIAIKKNARGGTLLDIGCWDGKKTLLWAKAMNAQKMIGLEVVNSAAKEAKKRKIETHTIDIDKDKWPIKDNTIDCVISNLVIEHLTDVDKFIKESYRVLKKGGYTIVSTNNLASWHNIISLVFGWAPFDLTNSTSKAWSIGNPLVTHKNEKSLFGKSYCHKCVYTTKWLREWYNLYRFKFTKLYPAGYYPLPNIIAKLDPIHCAFIILVFQK